MAKLKLSRNLLVSILTVFLLFTNIPVNVYAEENKPAEETSTQEVIEQEENLEQNNENQNEEQEEEPVPSLASVPLPPMTGLSGGSLNPSSLELKVGGSGDISCEGLASYEAVSATSSDTSVADVEFNFVYRKATVTANGVGNATITVTFSNGSKSVTETAPVTVTAAELTTPAFATKIDGTDVSTKELLQDVAASIIVETNSNGTITAESSDKTIVTVNLADVSGNKYEIYGVKPGTANITFSTPSTETYKAASKIVTVTVNEKIEIETLNVTSVPTAYYTTNDNKDHLFGNFALADNSHAIIDVEVYGYGYAIAVISAETGYKFKIADSLQTTLTGETLDKVWTGKQFKESVDSGADVYDDALLIGVDVPQDQLLILRELKDASMSYDKKTGIVTITGAKLAETSVEEFSETHALLTGYDIINNNTESVLAGVNEATKHNGEYPSEYEPSGNKNVFGDAGTTDGTAVIDLKDEALTYTSATYAWIFVYSNYIHLSSEPLYYIYGIQEFLLPSKVTFDLNGGNINSSTDNVMRYLKDGDAIDADLVTEPVKGELAFVGWFTEANGGTKVTSFTGTDNVTYYAHYAKAHNWTQIKENTLSATFDADLTEEDAIEIAKSELGTSTNKLVYYKYEESEQCYKALYYTASWATLDCADLIGYLASGAEVYAIGTTTEAPIKLVVGGTTTYCVSFEEAFNKIGDGQTATITLLDDVTIEDQIFLKEGRNVTIDLNGNDLSADFESITSPVFKIGNATLTITGEGTVYGGEKASSVILMFGSGDTSATDYSVFNLDEDAKLDHINVGIRVNQPNKDTANDYGVKINIKGQITGSLENPAILVNGSLVGTGDNIAQINIDGAKIEGYLDLSGVSKTRLYNNPEISAMYKTIVVQKSNLTIENGSYYPNIPDGEDETPIALSISKDATGTLNIKGGNFYGITVSKTDAVNSFVTGGKFLDLDRCYVADTHGRKAIDEEVLYYEVVEKVLADKVVFENAPEYWQTDIYDLMDKYELDEGSKGEIKGLMTIGDDYQAYGYIYIHLSPLELYYFDANTKVEGLNGDAVSCIFVTSENISTLKLIYFEDLEVGDIFVIDKKLYRENTKDIEGISIDSDLKIHFANDEGYYFIEETNTDEQAKGIYDLYTAKPAYTYAFMKMEESELLGITTADGDSLKAYSGRTIAISHCSVYHYDQNEDMWIALIDGVSLVKVPELDKIDDKDVSNDAKGEFYINETADLSAHISGIDLKDIKGTDSNGDSTDNYSNIIVWLDKNSNGQCDSGETLTYGNDYTISQGSIVVTLTKSFLDTLKVGSHNVLVRVTDKNEIVHEFKIPVVIKSRSTGDTYTVVNTSVEGPDRNNGTMIAIVNVGLLALLIALTKKRKDIEA